MVLLIRGLTPYLPFVARVRHIDSPSCGHPIGDQLADDTGRPGEDEQVEKNADEEVGRTHAAVIPVHDEDKEKTKPEDDVAPARTNGSDSAVPFIFDDAAGTSTDERPDGCEEEEQNDQYRVEVVMSGT
jgi:hypothetical protein